MVYIHKEVDFYVVDNGGYDEVVSEDDNVIEE